MTDTQSTDTLIRRGHAGDEHHFGVLILLRSLREQRTLIFEMAKRELTDLHAGQAAGFFWALAQPLLLFSIYTVLFTLVFKVRIGSNTPGDYIVYLLAGLAPWLLTQDIIVRSTNTMIANNAIIKKVMFPPEVIVAKSMLAGLAVQSVIFVLTAAFVIIQRHSIPVTFLLLPVLVVLHLALLWGIGLLLAALTPYFRDTFELVRIFVTVNVYLIPVMYLPDMVPETLRFALYANPFSHLIWCYQDVFYFGAIKHPISWVVTAVFAAAALVAGSYLFARLRHHFSSVL